VRFGPFEFDTSADLLLRDGTPVRLPPQPTRVLGVLVRNAGDLVTREQLREAIWRDRFAEFDQGINFCIRQIRAALKDDADAPTYVETLPRRGYRFIASTQAVEPAKDASESHAGAPKRRVWFLVAAMVVGLAVVRWARGAGAAPSLDAPQGTDEAAAASLPPAVRVQFVRAVRTLHEREPGAYVRARGLLDSVRVQAPAFLPATIRLAEALAWSGGHDRARALLDSIIRHHPGEGRAYTLRGAVALFRDWDVRGAHRYLARGVALTPASSMAHHYAAYQALVSGDSAAARRDIERALALDPLSPALSGDAGMIFYWLRDYHRADSLCERGRAVGDSRPALQCLLVAAAARHDTAAVLRHAGALAARDSAPPSVRHTLATQGWAGARAYVAWEVDRLARIGEGGAGPGQALARARLHAMVGDTSLARRAVDAGSGAHSNALLFAGVDPLLDPIRHGPIFDVLRQRLGLDTTSRE
jgi:DNA-binding winged helix-turn-helix (wHTH) protein/Flp pilus assembly protein TadD